MKKNYQTPVMRIISIGAARIFCQSKSVTGLNSNVGLQYGQGSSTEGRSRSYDDSDWDWE